MAPRSAATREESWNSIHRSEASNEGLDVDMMEGQEQPQLLTINDVHRVLHPLQATADRVGKQVEKFAETLDRLGSKRDRTINDCRDVLPLVREYEKIAAETVKRLRKYHEPERQEKLKKSWKKRLDKSSRRSPPSETNGDDEIDDPKSTTVKDLQHWEQERQTWQLLGLMLQVEHPIHGKSKGLPEGEERYRRPKDTPKLHQFSSERDVWHSFLEQNPDMWEKHVVVEWLKSSADSVGQDIDVVVEQLESGADRGSGLWAHSWLYSKEAIKANKRLRSWPVPIDPSDPGIDATLISNNNDENLVTQLDPDAFSRQERQLQKEDIFFERAIWLACYEMIRRGHSWSAIREWCQERVEVWRALSIRGDPRLAEGPNGSKDVLSGWQARSIWRKMCAIAAREGGIDEYENAVYGILSGQFSSVEKVARGWDDYLFAVYNSQLLEGFDFFTRKTFASSLPWEVIDKLGGSRLSGISKPVMNGGDIWKEMVDKEAMMEEAQSPFKMIQGSIVAKQLWDFLVNQGRVLAHLTAQRSGRRISNALPPPQPPVAAIGPEDYDLLRILTHMILALQMLDSSRAKGPTVEYVVRAYVDFLGKAGKQQLLPLYASRLSEDGAVRCMAQQLPMIVDANERKTVLDLMSEYTLDVPRILFEQLILIIKHVKISHSAESSIPPRRIIGKFESKDPNENQPRLPYIASGFMGNEITGDQQDLINGMEWYLLLSGHWNETIIAGVFVYKHFLRAGALAAARELARRVPFSSISQNKTGDLMGQAIDLGVLSDDEGYDGLPAREAARLRHERTSSQMEVSLKKEYLLGSSITFRELENIVFALDAIESWKAVLDELSAKPDPKQEKELKAELNNAFELITNYIEPMLKKGWLQTPIDDTEASELHMLRRQYLPEIIIAYNTVITICGQYCTRTVLLQSMNLAALIAAENPEIASIFMETQRMSELVEAFAMSGRTMLAADETNMAKAKERRGQRGQLNELLGIWTVRRSEILKQKEKSNE